MKILFMDVDGPWIPVRAWMLGKRGSLMRTCDPVTTAFLLRLCATGVKVVLSSTMCAHGHQKVFEFLRANDFAPVNLHDDWSAYPSDDTGRVDMGAKREDVIREWLSKHPDVTHYVVVDDGKLEIDNFVRVTTGDGILYEHQTRIMELLDCHV